MKNQKKKTLEGLTIDRCEFIAIFIIMPAYFTWFVGRCFAQQYEAYLFFIYFGFVTYPFVYIINNNEIYKYIYLKKT